MITNFKYYPTIDNMRKLWSALGSLQKQIGSGGGGTTGVTSVNGDVGPAVVLDKADIGLSNVDNTSDSSKPVSSAVTTALNLKVDKDGTKVLSDVNFTTAKDTKLTGIATGATANSTDAVLLARANHTGTQAISTVTNLQTTLDSKAPISLTISAQAASYSLLLANAGNMVNFTSATAVNLTIPLNATIAFPIGTQIVISQEGAGQVTIVPTAGVTVHSAGGKLKSNVQYSTFTLIKKATDVWLASGDLVV